MTKIRKQVLAAPESYTATAFDEYVENHGAVLLDCTWDGGRFVSGVFMGGVFRSGEFVGGIFLGGIFSGGRWESGVWEGGFDQHGIYHPRGDDPACW